VRIKRGKGTFHLQKYSFAKILKVEFKAVIGKIRSWMSVFDSVHSNLKTTLIDREIKIKKNWKGSRGRSGRVPG
jgi:hypothetical protein